MRRYLLEAVGTMMLVLAFGLTSEPLALGLVLAALIYGGMFVSGAHFNPAVSFAYFIRRDINFELFIGYSISQILGAFAASGLLLMITNSVFYAEPPSASTFTQQITVEIFLSFLLVYAYLSLLNHKSNDIIRLNALGVGLTLTAAVLIGQNVSGAYLNPALSIGSSVVDYLAVKGNSFINIPLYIIAPLSGATLAALLNWYTSD
ncbi:MAG: MIP/aquaporin family protein [Balneolaceae bacterium]